ncbi:MAG: hypothetical protein ACREAA_02460 [Candidatus Polarisedimenticolia bacterium]
MTDWQDGRTPEERLADRALLLLAVNFGERVGRIDNFRLMKIPFAVQYQLNREEIKSFSYRFYREGHGPISKAIYEDRDVFKDAGLVSGGSNSLRLTKLGDQLARVVTELLAENGENQEILRVVETRSQKYAALPTWEAIKAEVYAMEVEVGGLTMTVGDAPSWSDVLGKLPHSSCKSHLRMSGDLVSTLTLAFSMNPEEIEAGSRDSGLTIDQVFAVS